MDLKEMGLEVSSRIRDQWFVNTVMNPRGLSHMSNYDASKNDSALSPVN